MKQDLTGILVPHREQMRKHIGSTIVSEQSVSVQNAFEKAGENISKAFENELEKAINNTLYKGGAGSGRKHNSSRDRWCTRKYKSSNTWKNGILS